MLTAWRSHSDYQKFVVSSLTKRLFWDFERIYSYIYLADKLFILNLDPLKKCLKPTYSLTGRPAKYQPELFRALVAMLALGIHSITKFVEKLRRDSALAIICGFDDTTDLPGIANFYDFIERLWLCQDKSKVVRVPKKGKPKKTNDGDKLPNKDPGIVEKMVHRLTQGKSIGRAPERLMQQILKECAVIPSAELGLLGPINKLSIAGDGAPLETGANHHGKKLCSCKTKGIFKCNCPRSYTDPSATWGWDSYHKRYFYGHTLYHITSADSPNDLPIHIKITSAARHDSVSFIFALNELLLLYPEFTFSKAILDSAHDAYPIYEMLYWRNIEPFIDLNQKRGQKPTYEGPISINNYGITTCPSGKLMLYWGYCKNRKRIKWRCPHYKDGLCPRGFRCSCSNYGRVIYTKPDDDLRLFTTTPRATKEWWATYKHRTTVERSIKRTLVDYNIEQGKVRSKSHWFFRAILAAINQHLDAQLNVVANETKLSTLLGLTRTTKAA